MCSANGWVLGTAAGAQQGVYEGRAAPVRPWWEGPSSLHPYCLLPYSCVGCFPSLQPAPTPRRPAAHVPTPLNVSLSPSGPSPGTHCTADDIELLTLEVLHCLVLVPHTPILNPPPPCLALARPSGAPPSADDNELLTLEVIHQFVEVLDKYFGNVCELDLIFNFHKVG